MTYLELVRALHREVGAAGTPPAAVSGLRGEANRLVNWVADADLHIQLSWNDWKFLRSEWTAGNTSTEGQATIARPATLKTWDYDTFRMLAPGETEYEKIEVVEYFKVRDEIMDNADAGRPSRVIIMPDNDLRLDPIPDGEYTVRADFYRKPTRLAEANSQSPIPEEFHSTVILGQAMLYYAAYENAAEMLEAAKQRLAWMPQLENDQRWSNQNAHFRTGSRIEVIASND